MADQSALSTIPVGMLPADMPAEQQAILIKLMITNDLSKLSETERWHYYLMKCAADRLDPRQQPYEFLVLNGKTVLYARKNCTDQIRARDGITTKIVSRETVEGVLIVEAEATDKSGRTDSDIGAVNVQGLKGDALANAYMKAVTKAKRRATLAMGGVGVLDETELDTIPSAQRVSIKGEVIDHETGEIVTPAKPVTARATTPQRQTVTAQPARPSADQEIAAAAIDQIRARADERKIDRGELDLLAWNMHDAPNLAGLTYGQGREFYRFVNTAPESEMAAAMNAAHDRAQSFAAENIQLIDPVMPI